MKNLIDKIKNNLTKKECEELISNLEFRKNYLDSKVLLDYENNPILKKGAIMSFNEFNKLLEDNTDNVSNYIVYYSNKTKVSKLKCKNFNLENCKKIKANFGFEYVWVSFKM